MKKQIRDEFVEHHEGQAVFTARRIVFSLILLGVAGFVAGWVLWGES